jgi:hypothetical protein
MTRLLIGVQMAMGVYGFSRGYRSKPYSKYMTKTENDKVENKLLLTTKVLNGFFNGVMYSLPIWNIPMVLNLFDRVEIEMKGYNKEEYVKSYLEWFDGKCDDTL